MERDGLITFILLLKPCIYHFCFVYFLKTELTGSRKAAYFAFDYSTTISILLF